MRSPPSPRLGSTIYSRKRGPWSRLYAPVVGFSLAQLGLVAGDEIDVGQVNWHFLQVVPEPGSFLLLGSGVVGLLILGKRRMKP